MKAQRDSGPHCTEAGRGEVDSDRGVKSGNHNNKK
jgi:hypothetical protein